MYINLNNLHNYHINSFLQLRHVEMDFVNIITKHGAQVRVIP